MFEDGQYIDSGFIDLHKDKDTEHRVLDMGNKLCQLIDKCSPNKVVIEDTMQMKNPSTLKVLVILSGVLRYHCFMNDIPYELLMPSEWRKILGIQEHGVKRPELKARAINLVYEQFGMKAEEDNAEAICIALATCVRDGLATIKSEPIDDDW